MCKFQLCVDVEMPDALCILESLIAEQGWHLSTSKRYAAIQAAISCIRAEIMGVPGGRSALLQADLICDD